MGILLLACIVAGCASGWIVFALYGPPPAPKPLLVVPRALPEPIGFAMAPTVAPPEAWIEGPTFQDAVAPAAVSPIVQPVLRRPRFEIRTAPVRVFAYEDRTTFDS